MRSVSLHCLAGPLKGQTFKLNGGPVSIFGRYAKATFSLSADPAASHLHFLVDTSDDRVRILDLGSTNGLVINETHMGGKQGPPFIDFVTLKSGDRILAGACLFRLSVVEESTVYNLASFLNPAGESSAANRDSAAHGNLTTVLSKDAVATRFAGDHPDDPALDDDGLPRIGGFTILEKIGGGGRGVVYKAIKDDSGAAAAIKLMNFSRGKNRKQRSIEMFRREIQITRQLHHPHIVHYLGDGISGGAPYLAIEYVDGGTLDELIRNSPEGCLDLPTAIPLFIQLLEAVAHMHAGFLVHRDIKPKNVLLDTRRGGGFAVKLSDMGLSCRFTAQDANEFLPIISEGGTPAYMPPEQLTDVTRAIPQSDVFSSAATFYQMVSGALLYDFKDKEQNEAILDGAVTPIHELCPDLPADIADVVTRGLAYQPENRYENAQEMLDAFKSALA